MSDPTCANCKFALHLALGQIACRRYPPTVQTLMRPGVKGQPEVGHITVNPPVAPNGWCGEHKPRLELA